jgi:hypothetical protein
MSDDVASDATASPQFITFGGGNLRIQGTGFWSAGRKKPQIVEVPAGVWQANLHLEPVLGGAGPKGPIFNDYTPGFTNGRIFDMPQRTDYIPGVGVPPESARMVGYNLALVGNLSVSGNMSKGSGSFIIDHPLDPRNKNLSHSFVESPDMMNLYQGLAVLDEHGEAWVELPGYFEALNRDFRYQLTAIGSAAPGLHVAAEVSGNRFKIAGGKPEMKVSWQVSGIRHDPYANAHRIKVEEEKSDDARGHYLHPELFESASVDPPQSLPGARK